MRKSYRVRVPRKMTEPELRAIAQTIVDDATARGKIDAICVLFYLPDTGTDGAYTAGTATWAPDGDWGKAGTALPPRLVVEAGSVYGDWSTLNFPLPVRTKKRLFMYVVRLERQGVTHNEVYSAAAQEFGLTVEDAKKICDEGVGKNWPMP